MARAVTTASGAIRRESWGVLVSKLIRSSSPVDWQADFGGLRDSYVGNRLRTSKIVSSPAPFSFFGPWNAAVYITEQQQGMKCDACDACDAPLVQSHHSFFAFAPEASHASQNPRTSLILMSLWAWEP